jgi:hypothetical protein
MKALNLTLHCGGHSVESTEVQQVATPMATDSWHPIPHFSLIERLREIVSDAGMTITQEAHALARNGLRYFGLFQVAGIPNFSQEDNIGTVIGLRNSHDKSFPAGINAGSAPFVCDNLAFHNEIKIARRHTKFIMRDLPTLLAGAFGKLTTTWGNNAARIEAYQSRQLNNPEAHDILARAYRCGAVSKTHLADVLDQWHNPEHEEWKPERNLWGLHNAFTNVMRGNVLALPKRSDALHGLLDPLAGVKFARAEEVGDEALALPA